MKCSRMLSAVCVLLVICSALSLPVRNPDLDAEFERWKKIHEKVYSGPEEEARRRTIWEESKKYVEAHNKEAAQGLHTYWMGMNQFSDMAKEERSMGCAFPAPEPTEVERIIVQPYLEPIGLVPIELERIIVQPNLEPIGLVPIELDLITLEPLAGNFTNMTLDEEAGKNSSMVPNVGEIENQ